MQNAMTIGSGIAVTAMWMILPIAALACAPGEIERRLTEYPMITCSAVMQSYPVCDPVRDGKQECHLEHRMVQCEPDGPVVIVICLPPDATNTGSKP